MTKNIWFGGAAVVGLLIFGAQAIGSRTVQAAGSDDERSDLVAPIVFQAAGPTVASIQSMVDAFRLALGGANNGSVPGPLVGGRREINWDGGGSTATSVVPTPFDGFLLSRGARFTTRGTGFVQAPVQGMADTFGNPSYAAIFQAFSPVRLFSAIGSNVTNVRFFVPGGGELPATTTGFGAVFTDVDGAGTHRSPASMVFYDAYGKVVYVAKVPASKGDASLSFLGVLFPRADIARVRIVSGSVPPGPDDSSKHDVVVMDDFIFGEPALIQGAIAQQLQETEALDLQ